MATLLPKYSGKEGTGLFRPMTLDEAKALNYGQHIWFLSFQGDARRAKVNGQPKVWKRSPQKVEVSLKYGMYEYSKYDETRLGFLLVEETLDWNSAPGREGQE